MQITIDIPDGQVNRTITAFASIYNYQQQIQDPNNTETISYIDNPQTKRQFTKQKIIEYIKQTVLNYELEQSRKSIVVSEIDVS